MSEVAQEGGAVGHPGWQGILDEGERILWQGQPDSRLRPDFGSLKQSLPALYMVLFSLFWMFQTARMGGIFPLFGLLFLFSGLWRLLKPTLWPSFLRSRTWYTLTDRRAIVATDVPLKGRSLTSYPIGRDTPVEYLPGDPPSVIFGHPAVGDGQRGAFRNVADADRVLALIRGIQRAPSGGAKP